MLRWRALGGLVAAALLGLVSPAFGVDAGNRAAVGRFAAPEAGSLAIYYTSPVLARAGERILMPVQVVCAGPDGRACGATVTLETRVGAAGWRSTSATASPGLTFDLSAPAARALASEASGSVQFVIRAQDGSGRATTLPPSGEAAPLSFSVATRIPVRLIPTIAFGKVRSGVTVLSLPWGSGSTRAGLSPGRESASLGPDSFDVDAHGRIYLLDSEQSRMAVFEAGRLVRATSLPLGAGAQLAADGSGGARVVTRSGGGLLARRVGRSGEAGPALPVPGASVDAVRTVRGRSYGLVLPLDAWVGLGAGSTPLVGLPLAGGGELLRVSRSDGIRLARSTPDGRLVDAIQLQATARVGEIALADPDARGGSWIVVHLWRELPTPADQYQVLHVVGTRVTASFAVANRAYTDTPPLSRFRIGGDGELYQLVSTAAGIQIVRFDLREER